MTGNRFSHFEMFKIVLNTIYIASGFVIFGALISNASEEYSKNKTEVVMQCENCDEID